MPRYRMVDVDWEQLDGIKVRVEVSASNICLELKDGRLLKIAVAMRERGSKPGASTSAQVDEALAALDGNEEVIPLREE